MLIFPHCIKYYTLHNLYATSKTFAFHLCERALRLYYYPSDENYNFMANIPPRDMTFDNVKHKIMQNNIQKQMFMAIIKIGTKTSNRINIKFMTITQKPLSRKKHKGKWRRSIALLEHHLHTTAKRRNGYDAGCGECGVCMCDMSSTALQ